MSLGHNVPAGVKDAKARVLLLLRFYLARCVVKGDVEWNADNEAKIEDLVDGIVHLARAAADWEIRR